MTQKIVYIEDEPYMVNLVTRILEPQGITVIGVNEGEAGLEKIHQEEPDLILLDIMMPGMDGWQVFKQIRSSEKIRHIPVIIITARAFDMDQILGLHLANVDDYITKPFRAHELVERVKRVIQINNR